MSTHTHARETLLAQIQHTLLNGDTETAVSIIELSKRRFDYGRILHQQPVAVAKGEDFPGLRHRLAAIGGEAVAHTLQHWDELNAVAVAQSDTG